MSKPILCLDFDGVIHSYASGWLGADIIIDPPVPGALMAIMDYREIFDVHIYSSRSHKGGGIAAMQKWLAGHLQADRDITARYAWITRDALGFVQAHIKWPIHKPPAMVSIDDRAITFDGVFPDVAHLKGFVPWNKH